MYECVLTSYSLYTYIHIIRYNQKLGGLQNNIYDILNQRFLIRTNERTGKVQKLLRLAVGTRSQLCPVADNFKVVVIVEEDHAADHLDLPLLNRFEI